MGKAAFHGATLRRHRHLLVRLCAIAVSARTDQQLSSANGGAHLASPPGRVQFPRFAASGQLASVADWTLSSGDHTGGS